MKRLIFSALLLGTATAVAAQVPPQVMYKDLVRPNGQKRSEAVYQADVDACYRQTGGNPYQPDSTAMKKCMLGRGYQFVLQRGFLPPRPSRPSHGDFWQPCDPSAAATNGCPGSCC